MSRFMVWVSVLGRVSSLMYISEVPMVWCMLRFSWDWKIGIMMMLLLMFSSFDRSLVAALVAAV